MTQKEFEAMLRNAARSPWDRFKDWIILLVFKIALGIGALWAIFHLQEIIDWWNGK